MYMRTGIDLVKDSEPAGSAPHLVALPTSLLSSQQQALHEHAQVVGFGTRALLNLAHVALFALCFTQT